MNWGVGEESSRICIDDSFFIQMNGGGVGRMGEGWEGPRENGLEREIDCSSSISRRVSWEMGM